MKMKMKAIGIEKAVARVEKLTEETQAKARAIVLESALNIQREAKKRAPVDTGNLRSRIHLTHYKNQLEIGIGTRVKYARAVEFGTQPHFPPPGALTGWAKRHGMAGNEERIAWKIYHRGTPAQPFLFPAFEQERPRFLAKVKQVIK
jgi:HK97 gp10 family phage protein